MPPPFDKCLNVASMTEPHLANYDAHVECFLQFLDIHLKARLVYDGPADIHHHILNRSLYACSVVIQPNRVLKDVFPVMIGSKLDLAIRHHRETCLTFHIFTLSWDSIPFQNLDIGRGFYIINGYLRHVPYFYTNDPTNTHVVRNKKARVYTYDAYDRGKELNYYFTDDGDRKREDVVVVNNDGSHRVGDWDRFFHHCPYPIDPKPYMAWIHRKELFDIDSLDNKMFISSGHMFVKLFVKYLYAAILHDDWKLIKSRHNLVIDSIEKGRLLHVLSRKTSYEKEGKSMGKMTKTSNESYREIGDNGQIFKEKEIGCYREVPTQTYPLNPYLLQMVVRQTSKKVKHNALQAFHPSSLGFLCILGCYETKAVGRTFMTVRNTAVSTISALDNVFHDARKASLWDVLKLEPDDSKRATYWVVVNEACIPVTKPCFDSIDLLQLKRTFGQIECFRDHCFVVVRFKAGLLMKKLPDTDVWVTPRDELYWIRTLYRVETKQHVIQLYGYDYVTGYMVDLNPFFAYNAFPKNILAFNSLKNAVLATDSRYSWYFMDTVSAYASETSYHRTVLKPKDALSERFVLKIPKVTVAYTSFLGSTQEDCIVRREGCRAFDCVRFFTLRIRIEADGPLTFHPVVGDPNPGDSLVGTLMNHGQRPLILESYSTHVEVVHVTPQQKTIRFAKMPFRVVRYMLTRDKLSISVEQEHVSSTGDKFCSLHGQKGVIRVVERMPLLDERVRPDILVNVYGQFRMTLGQFKEGLALGEGKDAQTVRNSDGQIVPGAKAHYAKIWYTAVIYLANEHLYAPVECTQDKLLGQAVRGRSRNGGMRIGYMECKNGMIGNGLAAIFEEKFFENGDRYWERKLALPKAVQLVIQDAQFFKCNLQYEYRLGVQEKEKNDYKEDPT